jgi:hypothetical protein
MRIFLSHASESKALVVRLTEPLPPHVQIWLDRDALAAGQRFGPRIEAAIRRDCDFVLVFIDEHALASTGSSARPRWRCSARPTCSAPSCCRCCCARWARASTSSASIPSRCCTSTPPMAAMPASRAARA